MYIDKIIPLGYIICEVIFMARKKAAKPPIVGNLDDDYIVEKSRPLMLMRDVPFSLGELKVLDTYLSRINARDPEATTVRFSKEEYENLMDIERMRPERLQKYVESIMQKTVSVPDKRARGGWKVYTLFEYAECSQDDNEQWWIDLTCTAMAKKLFFNLEKIGYVRYQLSNVLPLVSKHSVLLYLYLLDNRFRRDWTVSLDELREKVFRCNSEFYKENYKNFKQDILNKAIKEVNEKTDLTFGYEAVKTGRKVTDIAFTLIKDEVLLPVEEDEDEQFSLFDHSEHAAAIEEDPIQLSIDALPDWVTREQVEELRELARPHIPFEVHLNDVEEWFYHYFRRKTMMLKAKKNIKTPYAWLKKAVAEDWN